MDVSESPELGPPPIAHFDPTDPVKQDPTDKTELGDHSGKHGDGGDDNDTTADLFLNLETRRKRRPSSLIKDTNETPSSSVIQPANVESDDTTRSSSSLRVGAKRKLSARDEEESTARPSGRDKEGFSFNRKVALPAEGKADAQRRNLVPEKTSEKLSSERRRETPAAASKQTRKALGESKLP